MLLQSPSCSVDSECRVGEFCNGSRGVCLSCRRRRKRCARDGMCCGGNKCINGTICFSFLKTSLWNDCWPLVSFCHKSSSNLTTFSGVCQPADIDATQQTGKTDAPTAAVTRAQNFTMMPHPKRNTVLTRPQQSMKGDKSVSKSCFRLVFFYLLFSFIFHISFSFPALLSESDSKTSVCHQSRYKSSQHRFDISVISLCQVARARHVCGPRIVWTGCAAPATSGRASVNPC